MEKLMKILVMLMAFFMVMPQSVSAQKKEKKEKKKFEWVMPDLSGNETIDSYLLACDSLWTKVQNYAENMTTYVFKTDSIYSKQTGKWYIESHMENAEGKYLTRAASNWQLVEAIVSGTNVALEGVQIGAQTVSATTELPKLGLKALSYAKYVKVGPNIIGKATNEIKELATLRRSQWQQWKEMKNNAIDPETLGIWDEEALTIKRKCCFIKEIDDKDPAYLILTEKYEQMTEEEKDALAENQANKMKDVSILPEEEGKTIEGEINDESFEKAMEQA